MSLGGKTVIGTGAANGIGLATLERLAAEGARLVALDSDTRALASLRERIGPGLEAVAGDVREAGTLEAAAAAVARLGGCAGVVNNAGIMVRKPMAELAPEAWDAVLSVNLTAPFRIVRRFEAGLRAEKGAVVNVCSTRAHMSEPDTESYAASKGGLLALTHALAISLGPDVRVNAVSPGWIDVSSFGPGRDGEALRPEDHAQHPAGRVGRPEDVAEIVAFLLDGARSGFVTGAEFVADGGMTRKMIYAK